MKPSEIFEGENSSLRKTFDDEPKCCEKCRTWDGFSGSGHVCANHWCICHKPHWESDYAAMWERYEGSNDYRFDDLRQDILELIRKIVK